MRNGRLNRLEGFFEKRFPVDAEDEHRNTALIVAYQVRVTGEVEKGRWRAGRGGVAFEFTPAYINPSYPTAFCTRSVILK